MEVLKSYILNICCTLFFITVVEMLLPNNSLKKYAKFVLGLILISVIIRPVLNLVNKDFSSFRYVDEIVNDMDSGKIQNNLEKYKEENINNTLNNFRHNLKISCERTLKEKYPNLNFTVKVDAYYSKELDNYCLNKIYICTEEKNNTQIINYLSEQLGINKNLISVSNL